MTRKRFSADELSRRAEQALNADRSSPPTRDVSLTDVVRALAPRIKERRDAGHPFPRIAGWLGTLGYEVSAATLCVYWHRLSREGERLTTLAAEDPRPPPAPAIKAAAPDTTSPPSAYAVVAAAKAVPVEVSPTSTKPTRPKGPRDIA